LGGRRRKDGGKSLGRQREALTPLSSPPVGPPASSSGGGAGQKRLREGRELGVAVAA
jgi:hypothetical protein